MLLLTLSFFLVSNALLYLSAFSNSPKKYSILDDTEFDAEKKHTSMIFRGMEYGGRAYNTTNNNSLHQLERMNESEFDFMREDSRFTAISDELKKYAKKH